MYSPGDLVTFHRNNLDHRDNVKVVCSSEEGKVSVSGCFGHTFDAKTGRSACGKRAFIKHVSFEDAVNRIMEKHKDETVQCGRERVVDDLKERIIKFKVHEILK